MHMSTGHVRKERHDGEPVGTGRWGAVRESGGVSELYSGGVEIPPVCVRADSMSPVQLCAKANLQIMLKDVCERRLCRGM